MALSPVRARRAVVSGEASTSGRTAFSVVGSAETARAWGGRASFQTLPTRISPPSSAMLRRKRAWSA